METIYLQKSRYGEVCLSAFGRGFEVFTTFLLILFLMFVIVAYMILIRSIWTPVILSMVSNSSEVDQFSGNIVLLALVLLMSPFLIRKDLHALRFNCYIGFASITILCTAIVYRAYQKCQNENINITNHDYINDPIVWATNNFWDGLYAFPIIMLSFFCAFNINPVQSALIKPSRTRIQYVIHISVGCCFILMYTFGLAGYLFARSKTNGNILLNFDVGDQMIIIGRIGSGLTILMNTPLILLPCRQSILQLISNIMQSIKSNDEMVFQDLEDANESSMLVSKELNISSENREIPSFDNYTHDLSENRFIHLTSTFLIAIVCYTFAVTTPGVAIVWSICGSSMAFLIGFIIPCACYIKIRQFDANIDWYYSKIMSAWVILVISVIAAIACTIQSIWRIMHSIQ